MKRRRAGHQRFACLIISSFSKMQIFLFSSDVADHQPIQVNCEPATVWPLPGLLLVGICMLWLFTLFAMSLLHWFRPSLQFPAPLAALCLQRHLQHCLRTTSLPPGHFNAIPGMQVLTVCLFVLGQAQVWVMPYLGAFFFYSSIIYFRALFIFSHSQRTLAIITRCWNPGWHSPRCIPHCYPIHFLPSPLSNLLSRIVIIEMAIRYQCFAHFCAVSFGFTSAHFPSIFF